MLHLSAKSCSKASCPTHALTAINLNVSMACCLQLPFWMPSNIAFVRHKRAQHPYKQCSASTGQYCNSCVSQLVFCSRLFSHTPLPTCAWSPLGTSTIPLLPLTLPPPPCLPLLRGLKGRGELADAERQRDWAGVAQGELEKSTN